MSDSTASLSCTRACESCSTQAVSCLTSSLAFCSSLRTSSITCRRNSSESNCGATLGASAGFTAERPAQWAPGAAAGAVAVSAGGWGLGLAGDCTAVFLAFVFAFAFGACAGAVWASAVPVARQMASDRKSERSMAGTSLGRETKILSDRGGASSTRLPWVKAPKLAFGPLFLSMGEYEADRQRGPPRRSTTSGASP